MSVKQITSDAALSQATQHHALSKSGSSVADITDRLVGLHTTSPASPYLSLRARLPGFERRYLDMLMWDSWRMVRFRAMRLTMFVFTREVLEIAAAATRSMGTTLAQRWLRDSGLDQKDFDRLADAIDDALASGPLTVRQLRRILGVPREVDVPGVVGRMCDVGRLVGGAPPRSWRSPVRRYHRWVDVLADVDLARWDEEAAIGELVGRYIAGFGPVTLDDMAWWTGLTKGRCWAALESLGEDLEPVAVEGWPGPLYRLRSRPVDGDLSESVAALPLLDPYVQGYRDRTRLFGLPRHDYVYDGGGNSAATLVHRGRVIGVWQTSEEPAPSVRYHLFEAVPASVRAAAEVELAAAGAMYFDETVDVVGHRTMVPLSAGGGRSAMHPLDGRIHRASRRGRQAGAV